MAKATGKSQSTGSRIWRVFRLRPWASDTFSSCLRSRLFIEKVRDDVVGL
jgi:hypothetical protein